LDRRIVAQSAWFTEQNADEWVVVLAEQIRNGNSSLGDEYLNAYKETRRTLRHAQFVAIQLERELTAGEQEEWTAADEASDESFEHFERVLSEVSASCKKSMRKAASNAWLSESRRVSARSIGPKMLRP
jgi:hypothetical protein